VAAGIVPDRCTGQLLDMITMSHCGHRLPSLGYSLARYISEARSRGSLWLVKHVAYRSWSVPQLNTKVVGIANSTFQYVYRFEVFEMIASLAVKVCTLSAYFRSRLLSHSLRIDCWMYAALSGRAASNRDDQIKVTEKLGDSTACVLVFVTSLIAVKSGCSCVHANKLHSSPTDR
jgi:hypothetical protein